MVILSYLEEVTAKSVDRVHAYRSEAELQTSHQVLLQVRLKGRDLATRLYYLKLSNIRSTHLLRVNLANKGYSFEVLKAQVRELEKLR